MNSRPLAPALWAAASLLASVGCSSSEPATPPLVETEHHAITDARALPAAEDGEPQGGAPQPPAEPLLLLTDPPLMRALEAQGLRAGPLAFGRGGSELASFAESPAFKRIYQAVKADIEAERRADPKAGVGMSSNHRLFDLGWLGAKGDRTRFELIGVVNRADRQPFAREHCGETRLVYRLAYSAEVQGERVDSRLPMTLNLVFWQDAPSCRAAAQRWIPPASLKADTLLDWLRGAQGPLADPLLARAQLKAVEINLQLLRWPSLMHPSLGGHASYVLRVFTPQGEGLTVAALENTPDLERLRRHEDERQALLRWLRTPETLSALDAGTAVMPQRFAATRSISVTPHGLGRLANRPFSQLFKPAEFADLELDPGAREVISSPRGLLRRLDGLSCAGCHETRSVAGFHLLGEAADPTQLLDAMFVPSSPHLDGDLERRAAWVRALARGESGDEARPHSDFERHPGAYGSHCGLGDPAFASWTCAPELSCVALADPDMGSCLDPARGAGDPCEIGELRTHARATRDRVSDMRRLACAGGATCNSNKVGFPGGMCTTSCDALGEGEACGAIVNLRAFNNCIAARRPFPRCIEGAAFEAGMRRCDSDHRCRDDYICARSPSRPDAGVCLPPYFLFQMRVDGHVLE